MEPIKSLSNKRIPSAYVNLLHLNTQGIKNKVNDLESLIYSQQNNFDVICLSEHWLTCDEAKAFCIDGWYIGHSFSRSSMRRGGSLILVRKETNCREDCATVEGLHGLSVESHCEISAVRLDKFKIFVICIYSCPSRDFNLFLSIMESLLEILNVYDDKVILCGDFNVRFYIDSDCTIDREATILQNLLSSYGFKRKIFLPTRKKNCLDNIFINFDAQKEYANVLETTFSDHDAQVLHVSFTGYSKEYVYKRVRPLTQVGFSILHEVLSERSWNFIDDFDGGGQSR